MASVFAQLERRMIAERTRVAMQAAKRKGKPISRPAIDRATSRQIVALMREPGASYAGVARMLNDEGVATARGGSWFASTVRQVVLSS